ncbi:helix-turn-helix domain-containing protein [Kibdelosporangium aridum]|uniref:helix-turn-helix domain-containing protein n=1 Tax=Kibdelosporangium aridum TaxID=2030 RepID=UPI001179EBC8|nr:helix-turn-helix transcriptional regulator [Kibdelosporangium aridum]
MRAELRRLGSDSKFTTRHVSRLERGETHWPKDQHVRSALRLVLGVPTDEDLGFHNSRRREPTDAPTSSHQFDMPTPSHQPNQRDDRKDGSCAHVLTVRQLLPENFFDQQMICAALNRRDFGVVFRAVRRHTGLNQVELGGVLGFTQGRVSKIESGKRGLHEFDEVVRVANVLGLDPWRLGFGKSARCEACRGTESRSGRQ